jgi:purine-nucleoside phosphorylase
MIVSDHINFMGVNPLRYNRSRPASFLDLTHAYSARLRREVMRAAAKEGVRMHSGVYIGVSGPSYETPAEIRAFRKLGANAVGMSLIPEVLMARACGLEVAAVSCITNPAAGLRRKELSHEEVLAIGRQSSERALKLFSAFADTRTWHSRQRKKLKIKSLPVGSKLENR